MEIARLGEFIGTLTRPRIDQILAGIQFVQRLTDSSKIDRQR
jgi:hypothetical protein